MLITNPNIVIESKTNLPSPEQAAIIRNKARFFLSCFGGEKRAISPMAVDGLIYSTPAAGQKWMTRYPGLRPVQRCGNVHVYSRT